MPPRRAAVASSASTPPTSRTRRRSARLCSTICARRSRATNWNSITSRSCVRPTTSWSVSKRWEHEERGFVSPGVFIPAAEQGNLINLLGEWALKTACQAAATWPKTVRVAVNVSAVQFANAGLPDIVAQTLAASGLEPDRLELELTESVFMGDSETVDETFKKLKELGVRLALDG